MNDRKEWRALHAHVGDIVLLGNFCFVTAFLRTALPVSADHLERGGIPLHDAVGINCENLATTEYQGAGA